MNDSENTPDDEAAEPEILETISTTIETADVQHTAESLGIEVPDDRAESEALLMRELGEARQEAAALLDSLQRVTAEFDNYRKRTDRDRAENLRLAGQRVVESMLPALDSFDAAMTIEAKTEKEETMLAGIRNTHGLVLEALGQNGLESIESVGTPFDPALHEAVSVLPGEGKPVVDQEVRKGYTMSGRVIRPSLVIVGHA